MTTTQATICAACGGLIVDLVGEEFCSEPCKKAGRSFCKSCDGLITQNETATLKFCSDCQSSLSHKGTKRGSLVQENCIKCGRLLPPPRPGGHRQRQYCNDTCRQQAYRDRLREPFMRSEAKRMLEPYGIHPPEVQRALLEVAFLGPNTAGRISEAMLHEYQPRKPYRANTGTTTKLTWEKVTKIRHLYATERYTQRALAEKYGVFVTTISRIIRKRSWKPEDDPRRKEAAP